MVNVDDSDYDHYEANNQMKTHYMLRNVFDITANRVLSTVKASIEKNYDESTIIQYALDAFKEQIDRIDCNLVVSTVTDHLHS